MTYWKSKPQVSGLHDVTKPTKPLSHQLRTFITYAPEELTDVEKEAVKQAEEYAARRNGDAKKKTDY